MTLPSDMLDGAKEIDGWFYCKMISADTAVVNRPLEEEKHRYFDVAVAASVTGCVRAYLWENIQKCHGVLYCDTDSIAAHDVSGAALGPALGEWENEGNFHMACLLRERNCMPSSESRTPSIPIKTKNGKPPLKVCASNRNRLSLSPKGKPS